MHTVQISFHGAQVYCAGRGKQTPEGSTGWQKDSRGERSVWTLTLLLWLGNSASPGHFHSFVLGFASVLGKIQGFAPSSPLAEGVAGDLAVGEACS